MSQQPKVVGLRPGQILPGQPNQAIIATLEDLLERARVGELKAFAASATTYNDGVLSCNVSGADKFTILGGLRYLSSLIETQLQDMDD